MTNKNDEFGIEMSGRKWTGAEQAAPVLERTNVQKALFRKKDNLGKLGIDTTTVLKRVFNKPGMKVGLDSSISG